jgi:hypothetical protein
MLLLCGQLLGGWSGVILCRQCHEDFIRGFVNMNFLPFTSTQSKNTRAARRMQQVLDYRSLLLVVTWKASALAQ